eukprot:CAMPEP_0113320474 /NCGR_PEP_ID=MMETSP0010_2-20120614/14283_1 /TAXON_ID=216773 ORGANISM="Corethron hystrix, Strain 308" /NCGR_SAMPLE_ID=MMETSP0010_2 /ASSEMBLY_ACC=CAM_ASM_000155 /LENGTH=113 /DNA_ID=CAMNT_0000178293 /DNA_START=118 /DNA_END=456 /DNA_ORIENTATION=- /assembly_acc=CAM_ASM_000155
MSELRKRPPRQQVPEEKRSVAESNRKALLHSANSKKSTSKLEFGASDGDVAASLQRTHNMLSQQLPHMKDIHSTIVDDGESLKKTKTDQFGSLGSKIGNAGAAFRMLRMQEEW